MCFHPTSAHWEAVYTVVGNRDLDWLGLNPGLSLRAELVLIPLGHNSLICEKQDNNAYLIVWIWELNQLINVKQTHIWYTSIIIVCWTFFIVVSHFDLFRAGGNNERIDRSRQIRWCDDGGVHVGWAGSVSLFNTGSQTLAHWFPPECWLKHRLWGPYPQSFRFSSLGGVWDSVFLTSSQMLLLWLVQKSQAENHWNVIRKDVRSPKRRKKKVCLKR